MNKGSFIKKAIASIVLTMRIRDQWDRCFHLLNKLIILNDAPKAKRDVDRLFLLLDFYTAIANSAPKGKPNASR